jgi:hypothetical protein
MSTKALVTTGVCVGLVVCIGSGWLLLRAPSSVRKPEALSAVSAFAPTGALRATPKGPVAALAAPSVPASSQERSRQLQLEIERALVSVDAAQREHAYTELIPALIKLDPTAMKSVVERAPSGQVRDELLQYTAYTWSSIDLTGAIVWVKAVEDNEERRVAAGQVVSQVARSDPAHAIEVSDELGIGRNDGTVERIAALWATQNLDEALHWVEAQPPGKQRDQLLARVATIQAQTAPAEAADTVLKEVSPGVFQDDAVASVARSWSMRDAAAASEWVKGLPPGRLRELAQAEVDRTVRTARTEP